MLPKSIHQEQTRTLSIDKIILRDVASVTSLVYVKNVIVL